jgi:hypothetical protein
MSTFFDKNVPNFTYGKIDTSLALVINHLDKVFGIPTQLYYMLILLFLSLAIGSSSPFIAIAI